MNGCHPTVRYKQIICSASSWTLAHRKPTDCALRKHTHVRQIYDETRTCSSTDKFCGLIINIWLLLLGSSWLLDTTCCCSSLYLHSHLSRQIVSCAYNMIVRCSLQWRSAMYFIWWDKREFDDKSLLCSRCNSLWVSHGWVAFVNRVFFPLLLPLICIWNTCIVS